MHGSDGFTLVEVLVSVILLAIMTAGVATAVTSTSRSAVKGSANDRELAAARRAFDSIRTHRGWMNTCTSGTCDVTAAVGTPTGSPAAPPAMRDRSLSSCTAGTFAFKLVKATATAVDSRIDGTGANDSDGQTPDYYTIHVDVDAPTECDRARLGLPLTVVSYESSVDLHGDVPDGSLTVSACKVINQNDRRMNISGCRSPYEMDLIHDCPPIPPAAIKDDPAKGCATATSSPMLKTSPTGAWIPSMYSWLQPANVSFTITGPGVSRSASTGGSGSVSFNDLPAGTYTINVGSVPSGYEEWSEKMQPSSNYAGTVLKVTVQPDVLSTAFIALKPVKVNTFKIHFTRRIDYYKAVKTSSHEQVTTHEATDTFEGDEAGFLEWMKVQSCPGSCTVYHVPAAHWVSGNCIYGTLDTYQGSDGAYLYSTTYHACSYFDLAADFKYWYAIHTGSATWNGAVVDAKYLVTPAPTDRENFAPPSATDYYSVMNVSSAIDKTKGYNQSFAASTYSFNNKQATGLNTGIYATNGFVTSSHMGRSSTVSSNTQYTDLPAALYKAMWILPNGKVQTESTTYPQGKIFTVKGRGECYWNADKHLGPCSTCSLYVPGMGHYPDCDLLYHTHWCRHVYVESDATGYYSGPVDDCGNDSSIQLCSSAPQGGSSDDIAPNCYVNPPAPPGDPPGPTTPSPGVPTKTYSFGPAKARVKPHRIGAAA